MGLNSCNVYFLFRCNQADDFEPAKILMNMCFTFFLQINKGKSQFRTFFKVFVHRSSFGPPSSRPPLPSPPVFKECLNPPLTCLQCTVFTHFICIVSLIRRLKFLFVRFLFNLQMERK